MTTATVPPLAPAGLRCAYLVNPLGVAPERIALSWELQGAGRDRRQSGYQVQVAAAAAGTVPSFASPVWDSGRVGSGDCTGISYDGPPLAAGGRYAWRVRAFDSGSGEPAWSEPAWFETELDPAGWQGAWVSRGRVRESFTPPTGAFDPMRHAVFSHLSAVGQSALSALSPDVTWNGWLVPTGLSLAIVGVMGLAMLGIAIVEFRKTE